MELDRVSWDFISCKGKSKNNGILGKQSWMLIFADMCVHVDDGGDHLHPHLRPLHHARAGRGDRRRPLRQRDRVRARGAHSWEVALCFTLPTWRMQNAELSTAFEEKQPRWETGIHALRIVDTITMWFFTIGQQHTVSINERQEFISLFQGELNHQK